MTSGIIDPTPVQQLQRDKDRIPLLREKIAEAEAVGNSERVASLQEELDRRLDRVRAMKAALAEVDAD
jgi:hypothetical protein